MKFSIYSPSNSRRLGMGLNPNANLMLKVLFLISIALAVVSASFASAYPQKQNLTLGSYNYKNQGWIKKTPLPKKTKSSYSKSIASACLIASFSFASQLQLYRQQQQYQYQLGGVQGFATISNSINSKYEESNRNRNSTPCDRHPRDYFQEDKNGNYDIEKVEADPKRQRSLLQKIKIKWSAQQKINQKPYQPQPHQPYNNFNYIQSRQPHKHNDNRGQPHNLHNKRRELKGDNDNHDFQRFQLYPDPLKDYKTDPKRYMDTDNKLDDFIPHNLYWETNYQWQQCSFWMQDDVQIWGRPGNQCPNLRPYVSGSGEMFDNGILNGVGNKNKYQKWWEKCDILDGVLERDDNDGRKLKQLRPLTESSCGPAWAEIMIEQWRDIKKLEVEKQVGLGAGFRINTKSKTQSKISFRLPWIEKSINKRYDSVSAQIPRSDTDPDTLRNVKNTESQKNLALGFEQIQLGCQMMCLDRMKQENFDLECWYAVDLFAESKAGCGVVNCHSFVNPVRQQLHDNCMLPCWKEVELGVIWNFWQQMEIDASRNTVDKNDIIIDNTRPTSASSYTSTNNIKNCLQNQFDKQTKVAQKQYETNQLESIFYRYTTPNQKARFIKNRLKYYDDLQYNKDLNPLSEYRPGKTPYIQNWQNAREALYKRGDTSPNPLRWSDIYFRQTNNMCFGKIVGSPGDRIEQIYYYIEGVYLTWQLKPEDILKEEWEVYGQSYRLDTDMVEGRGEGEFNDWEAWDPWRYDGGLGQVCSAHVQRMLDSPEKGRESLEKIWTEKEYITDAEKEQQAKLRSDAIGFECHKCCTTKHKLLQWERSCGYDVWINAPDGSPIDVLEGPLGSDGRDDYRLKKGPGGVERDQDEIDWYKKKWSRNPFDSQRGAIWDYCFSQCQKDHDMEGYNGYMKGYLQMKSLTFGSGSQVSSDYWFTSETKEQVNRELQKLDEELKNVSNADPGDATSPRSASLINLNCPISTSPVVVAEYNINSISGNNNIINIATQNNPPQNQKSHSYADYLDSLLNEYATPLQKQHFIQKRLQHYNSLQDKYIHYKTYINGRNKNTRQDKFYRQTNNICFGKIVKQKRPTLDYYVNHGRYGPAEDFEEPWEEYGVNVEVEVELKLQVGDYNSEDSSQGLIEQKQLLVNDWEEVSRESLWRPDGGWGEVCTQHVERFLDEKKYKDKRRGGRQDWEAEYPNSDDNDEESAQNRKKMKNEVLSFECFTCCVDLHRLHQERKGCGYEVWVNSPVGSGGAGGEGESQSQYKVLQGPFGDDGSNDERLQKDPVTGAMVPQWKLDELMVEQNLNPFDAQRSAIWDNCFWQCQKQHDPQGYVEYLEQNLFTITSTGEREGDQFSFSQYTDRHGQQSGLLQQEQMQDRHVVARGEMLRLEKLTGASDYGYEKQQEQEQGQGQEQGKELDI